MTDEPFNGGHELILPVEDETARAFAEKFKISPDKAKRLIDLHRALVDRESRRRPKR